MEWRLPHSLQVIAKDPPQHLAWVAVRSFRKHRPAGELWNVNSPRRCRSARAPVVGQASSPAAKSPTCFPWALRPARVKVFSVFSGLWCKSLLVGLLTVDHPGTLTESHACRLIS